MSEDSHVLRMSLFLSNQVSAYDSVADADDSTMDFSHSQNYMGTDEDDGGEDDDVFIRVHMNIKQSLNYIKTILASQVEDIEDYTFTLQDSQELKGETSLLDHCIQGEGLVQIDLQLREGSDGKRINIVDVLKPSDESQDDEVVEEADCSKRGKHIPIAVQELSSNWVVDADFMKQMKELRFPKVTRSWSKAHVRHWIEYIERRFDVKGLLRPTDWELTGAELCLMLKSEFKSKVPAHKFLHLWAHFELLRKKNAILVPPEEMNSKSRDSKNTPKKRLKRKQSVAKKSNDDQSYPEQPPSPPPTQPTKSGNPQVLLWQFLLDLLTDPKFRDSIQWVGDEGEFELINPETVALMWGLKKNEPSMNFQIMSQALCYQYDGDMISKVPGKKFVYKFSCDLKYLIGYSASELNAYVTDAERAMGEKITCSVDFPNDEDSSEEK